ncbi:hypothetical protein GCM10023238_16780 [Streptomyces heliomycini]
MGESDGVEIRVLPEPGEDVGEEEGAGADGPGGGAFGLDESGDGESGLGESGLGEPGVVEPEADEPEDGDHAGVPSGLRLELVDPGEETPDGPRTGAMSAEATAASAANSALAPLGALELPALNDERTRREYLALRGAELTGRQRAEPYIGPRPAIVTRRGWGPTRACGRSGSCTPARSRRPFVHHTASGNTYTCAQAPSLVRGFYRYHVRSLGWRDIGYNFLVDKCGRIYEGRAGEWRSRSRGPHPRVQHQHHGHRGDRLLRLQEAVLLRREGRRPAHRVENSGCTG